MQWAMMQVKSVRAGSILADVDIASDQVVASTLASFQQDVANSLVVLELSLPDGEVKWLCRPVH